MQVSQPCSSQSKYSPSYAKEDSLDRLLAWGYSSTCSSLQN